MIPKTMIRVCFEISTLYAIFLFVLFILKRDAIVPITYRSYVYKYGELQQLMRDSPLVLNVEKYNLVMSDWCPINPNAVTATPVSAQCGCISDYLEKFENNSAKYLNGEGPETLAALGEKQADGVLDSCMRERTTWKKRSGGTFCQVRLVTPVMLACLCMSLLFSRIAYYESDVVAMIAAYLPIVLALAIIILSFIWDLEGAVPVTLIIFSTMMEMFLTCHCIEDARVYWSFQRFFIGSLAVWAAISHQGRDIYVVTSYAMLGFFVGMLTYAQYTLRYKQGCNTRMRVVSVYAWVGVCVISACFFLLVQQHWYRDSPMWSSSVSVACLGFSCLQCIAMLPGMCASSLLQLIVGFALLSVSVLTVGFDILSH